jgi:glycosyltransferase involved in cell wall biosynthesis
MRPVLQQADIFLMTSRYEGMPIAALEAFEAGLPLATSDIAGMAEIMATHPMAVFLDPAAPQASADRIVALLADWRSDPLANSRRIASAWETRFSFPNWRRNLLGLVAKILTGKW